MRLPFSTLPLALLLTACQSSPSSSPADTSQYLCPNGLMPRVSLNADKSTLYLSIKGRKHTLRYDEKIAAYSNGRTSAKLDQELLHLDSSSSLLRQNCRLQIPASNAGGNPQGAEVMNTAKEVILKGSITYRQRIALGPAAVVKIRLEDVSGMDIAATVIAETTLEKPGQVPIAFTLSYDDAQLEAGHRYALRARIEEEGKLRFINTAFVSLPATPAAEPLEILVEPVGL